VEHEVIYIMNSLLSADGELKATGDIHNAKAALTDAKRNARFFVRYHVHRSEL
jgi:hypothetical protein